MTSSPAARTAVVLVVALIVQVSVVPYLGVRGYVGDVMLLMAAAGGLLLGVDRGMSVGFAAGLCTDLVVSTPFGLWAVVGLLVGAGGGSVAGTSAAVGPVTRAALTAFLTAAGVLAFVALALLLGRREVGDVHVVPAVVMVALSSALASPVATFALRWAFDRVRLPGEAL